ncbi:MAG: alkaline phosphatase family protein [Desulfobacterales bacterium]|nr:alkaline phosphatase family protein [Desulfobacterales bacterium]
MPIIFLLLIFVLWLVMPACAFAYIGPGAGFAVISSFFILLATGFLAVFTILLWPFRAGILYLKKSRVRKNKKAGRVIVLGFDGLDPGLVNEYMNSDLLPHFKNLSQSGTFSKLSTTKPSISPVAWSSFATGVNPGKHRIFDFYTRDTNTYLPVLSSAEIATITKPIKIGPLKWQRNKTVVRFLRKATSFWQTIGKNGIFSSVLRVPISFPPEKFYGASLSAMCTPDLRGSQGAFTCYTSAAEQHTSGISEGAYVPVEIQNNCFQTQIYGPRMPGQNSELTIHVQGKLDLERNQLILQIHKNSYRLMPGEYSPWIRLSFKTGVHKKVTGIARFLLKQIEPDMRLYMSPINIDPEKPVLPVSHPFYYSVVLSKLYGPFSTLGLSEDTWALNEGVIDEQDFLDQSYDIYEDRKKHFFDALKKNREGLIVSVFDTSDRIQHMFFRYLDPDHPANTDKDNLKHKLAIQGMYQRMDQMVGEVMSRLKKNDVLMIISDHGFTQFKWGININSWLWKNGYLVFHDNMKPGGSWFENVDWRHTKAYGMGLTGIFINLEHRESQGIVKNGDERFKLQLELKEKLESLIDEKTGIAPIRRAMLCQMNLSGPYVDDAPDLLIGYEKGYRASWNSAVGKATDCVIEPNTRRWSGDHSVDPELVPGIFFCNRKVQEKNPSILDIAPTIQDLFGVPPLKNQDGRTLNLSFKSQRP